MAGYLLPESELAVIRSRADRPSRAWDLDLRRMVWHADAQAERIARLEAQMRAAAAAGVRS